MKSWTQAMKDAYEAWIFPNREQDGDIRYNEPKKKHNASDEEIDEAIESTDIYRRAKEHILKAQRGQIGYGLGKYPETLNPHSWSTIETIQHIIEESIDKIHYLTMLEIQLTEKLENQKIVNDKLARADFDGDFENSRYTFDGKPLPFISIHPDLEASEKARQDFMRKMSNERVEMHINTDSLHELNMYTSEPVKPKKPSQDAMDAAVEAMRAFTQPKSLSDRTTATVTTSLTDILNAIYTIDLNMELQLTVNEGPDVFIERVNEKLQQMKENGQI